MPVVTSASSVAVQTESPPGRSEESGKGMASKQKSLQEEARMALLEGQVEEATERADAAETLVSTARDVQRRAEKATSKLDKLQKRAALAKQMMQERDEAVRDRDQSVETLERDQDSGIGRVVRFTAGAMGLSISYTLQYTVSSAADDEDGGGGEDEQGLVLAWQSIAGGVKSIAGHYHLSPAQATGSGDGEHKTRVRYKLDVDTGFKMPAMLRRTATSLVVGAALPDLKKHLEKDSTPSGSGRRSSWFGMG